MVESLQTIKKKPNKKQKQKTNTATTEFKIQVAVKCKDGDGVILCVWLVIQDNNNEILKESHQDSHHHFQFQAADIIRPNSPSSPKTPAHPFVFVVFFSIRGATDRMTDRDAIHARGKRGSVEQAKH